MTSEKNGDTTTLGQGAFEAQMARESGLLDSDNFFIEDYFVQLVAYERKKTERSQAPFLLMLLRLHDRFFVVEDNDFVSRLAAALGSATRETDVKGWYRYPYTVGVLCTDTARSAEGSIQRKVMEAIGSRFSPEDAEKIAITFHAFPGELETQQREGVDLRFYPDLAMKNSAQSKGLFVKRAIDLFGSFFGLLLFSPVFFIIATCIKLTSKGPVFFRQERVGQYGKRFEFLKFRSMHANNDPAIHQAYVASLIEAGKGKKETDADGKPQVFKIQNDPRITPIGRFIRKTSLDELPQLINVLRGEMSLVGPRPPIPYEVEKYEIWHRRRIFEVQPGITGLWQVEGRSRTTFDEMVRLDLKYVQEWSIWMDIKILIRTPLAVLNTKGAY
jgi:lipopolysaccharide/colanic/teichoic acid biosynthesis glycosyltransferase